MRIAGITATILATATLAVGGTTVAHADPASTLPTLRGSSDGVDYRASVAKDQRSVVTELAEGRFHLIDDGRIVTVTDRDDKVIAALPTVVRVGDSEVALRAQVARSGTQLTVAPLHQAADPVREVTNRERFFAEVDKAMPQIQQGAAIGAAIGFVLGFPLGLFAFDFITVPITTVVGAAIGAFGGLYSVGGDRAVEAARDYLLAPDA